MNKNIILKNTSSYEQELIEALRNKNEAQAYLESAFEEYEKGSAINCLLLSIKDVAKAQGGIGKLAKRASINREHLYRILSGECIPKIDKLLVILSALGFSMKLDIQKKRAA